MLYGSPNVRGKDARGALEIALEDTRRGAEAIRQGGGIFASTQLAAEIEAPRRHGEARGLLLQREALDSPPDAFGYEHQVWFPLDSGSDGGRVVKLTYPNCFGHLPDGTEASPVGYLQRLLLQNQVFGDDIRFEGLLEPTPWTFRVVTSQPAVRGRPAQVDEIQDFFTMHGFQRVLWLGKWVWFRPDDRMICADTHGGNVLVTDEDHLVAIDVPVMPAPAGFPDITRPSA